MSFPAAFSLMETLERFCAEDHQINFVTSTEVSVLNGHHKHAAQAWLALVCRLARIQDLAGRAKAMRGGGGGGEEKKHNRRRCLHIFGRPEAEERAECFDRRVGAYTEFC